MRKIFGDTMTRVVRDKAAVAAILASDGEDIKNIAASGGAYVTIEKAARNVYGKYLEKMVADKKTLENLKNNKTMYAEITDLVTTFSDANDETIDSIVARYNK